MGQPTCFNRHTHACCGRELAKWSVGMAMRSPSNGTTITVARLFTREDLSRYVTRLAHKRIVNARRTCTDDGTVGRVE